MATISNACPACGEGRVFDGWLSVRTRCERCGSVFLRNEGDWIGATVVAFMLSSVFIVLMLLTLFMSGMLTGAGSSNGLVWLIVCPSTLLFALVVLRPVKAFWVGLLYDWGLVYPDRDDDPKPSRG